MTHPEELVSDVEDTHVMPNFGKPHESSSKCWCRPQVDPVTLDEEKYEHRVWVHEPEN